MYTYIGQRRFYGKIKQCEHRTLHTSGNRHRLSTNKRVANYSSNSCKLITSSSTSKNIFFTDITCVCTFVQYISSPSRQCMYVCMLCGKFALYAQTTDYITAVGGWMDSRVFICTSIEFNAMLNRFSPQHRITLFYFIAQIFRYVSMYINVFMISLAFCQVTHFIFYTFLYIYLLMYEHTDTHSHAIEIKYFFSICRHLRHATPCQTPQVLC